MNRDEGIQDTNKIWDWIIIGTGIGGATFGHAMAEAGLRVLFLERGDDPRRNSRTLAGDFLETLRPDPEARGDEDFENAGRYHGRVWDAARRRWIHPILGSGVGGSSALFGMVMERFWPEDFEPGRFYPQAGADVPARWPISFRDLEPHYRTAERLYRVTGQDPDPLRPEQSFAFASAPALSADSRRLCARLRGRGLHPYALPLARQWGTPCRFCQSHLCAHDCKNDAAKMCLEPALRRGAALLSRATVIGLEADRERVRSVRVLIRGRERIFRADNIALAAGALFTPALLLKSRSAAWPRGLANSSGLVGRFLMRHYIDLWGLASLRPAVQEKSIGLNDFYLGDGDKYGTLADFGPMPATPIIQEDLDHDREASGRRPLSGLPRTFAGWGLSALMKHLRVLALIGEDLPHRENRVLPGDDGTDLVIHATISREERARIARARARVRRALGWANLLLPNAENTKLLAHACGTCRMSEDPRGGVVDSMNRAHDLANLFILDGSFFPTSGGVNPALTIAANALRVTARLCGESGQVTQMLPACSGPVPVNG
jgi:choline dehydrogenase-like flavoprotein